jgi:hypothetical protein
LFFSKGGRRLAKKEKYFRFRFFFFFFACCPFPSKTFLSP